MKKTIIQIVLGVVIVALAYLLINSILNPVRFDNEYNHRREACAERLKAIRVLEEQYKLTYGVYTGSFDTLFNRLTNEDSLKVVSKVINYDVIPEDVDINEIPETEAIKKGYKTLKEIYVNPLEKLREENKFSLSNEEMQNLRYVPYPKGAKLAWDLAAKTLDKNGFQVPVFECKVDLDKLMSDCDKQLVVNKIDELEKANRFPGWKVGSLDEAITDGNFE